MFLKINYFKTLIKKAWSGVGLTVGNDGEGIYLLGGYWSIYLDSEWMTKKAKAAIIELTGFIPAAGHAVTFWKGEDNQTEEMPEALQMYRALKEEVESLKERVTKLENGGVAPEPPAGIEVPAWEPWDGISNKYQYGAVVTIDQKYYISCYQDQNTWMPGSMGTEGLWKEISKEDAEAVIQGTKTPDQVINGQ